MQECGSLRQETRRLCSAHCIVHQNSSAWSRMNNNGLVCYRKCTFGRWRVPLIGNAGRSSLRSSVNQSFRTQHCRNEDDGTLRCYLTRVVCFSKPLVWAGGDCGWWVGGRLEEVVTANVAPGLAAGASADRPASFSKILHRRTGPSHGTTPPSTLAAPKGPRVRGDGDTAVWRQRPASHRSQLSRACHGLWCTPHGLRSSGRSFPSSQGAVRAC